MKNKYVSFISDEHLIRCIQTLFSSYEKAKRNISKKSFYNNKVDIIKLIFDAKFNNKTADILISDEILRQVDKSINNSIGTFHEQILGGIDGYESGKLVGYDIKATDNSLFADIKNKHNTMNSSSAEALFQKLKTFADTHKKAKCYWVQILAKGSFNELWEGEINGKEYKHSRVYKISGDRFYAMLTNQEDALYQLYKALPMAIDDFLSKESKNGKIKDNSTLSEIKDDASRSKRSIIDQITHDNFNYYFGFDKL